MPEKKDPKLDKAFAALLSDDDAKALEALATIQERGDARAIFPLLEALTKTTDHARQQRIHGMLFEVKAKDAAAELARALEEPSLRTVRKTAIAAFWNAGLDARPYTAQLIQAAIAGDAEEAFEVLTVIENQELLNEKDVLRAIKAVSAGIAQNTDEYKGAMLGSLLVELKARVGKDEPSSGQQDLFS